MNDALTVTAGEPVAPPKAAESAEYRNALSSYATGVTVITARWNDADWGMTCNSFSSVSLEPRLVLWSIRKSARSVEAFTRSAGFTVSVLSQGQRELARQFATGDMPSRFEGVAAHRQPSQRLRLCGAAAWFDCESHQLVDAGDHHIVIGAVRQFGREDVAALGFWGGQFVRFEAMPV